MASLVEIQRLVQQIKDDLPFLIQRSQIAPKQVITVTGLSDIADRLGLIQAGEFRTGNGLEPGYGFTGVRMGYPAFVYENEEWHVVGIEDDVLQFGLKADDGKAYAGGGSVVLSEDGIVVVNDGAGTPYIILKDQAGLTKGLVYNNVNDHMEIASVGHVADAEDRKLILRSYITDGDGIATIELIADNPDGDDSITINADTIFLVPVADGGVSINGSNVDADTSIQTVNNSAAFFMDAGLDTITSLAWQGWESVAETWTRTGNFTFTVSGDVTNKYRKGTRIRCFNSSFKLGVIGSVSHAAGTTTVTLIPNTDYLLAAAAITVPQISYVDNPVHFAQYFNFDPNWTNLSSGTKLARWRSLGTVLQYEITVLSATFSGNIGFDLPILPINPSSSITRFPVGIVQMLESGLGQYSGIVNTTPSSLFAHPRVINSSGTYASLDRINATVPFTWGTDDELNINGWYQF